MEVEYELTRDDLYAFQWRGGVVTPRGRRVRRTRDRLWVLAIQLFAIVAGASCVLQRGQVVVCQHLRPVLRAIGRKRLDPLGRLPVAVRPRGSGHLAVGDIAYEYVTEGVLRFAGNSRPPLAGDEFLPLECVEPILELPTLEVSERDERVRPEDLAEDGRVLEEGLLRVSEEVEPGRDDALHRFRKR